MASEDNDAVIEFGRGRVVDLRECPPAFIASYALLRFVEGDRYLIDTTLQQLIVATFRRSTETFVGVLSHLLDGFPTQAAMLARALFEDVVVGHWLLLNSHDPDWLVERFFAHRDTMALYQQRLATETRWRMVPVAGVDLADAKRRQTPCSRRSEARRKLTGGILASWVRVRVGRSGCGE